MKYNKKNSMFFQQFFLRPAVKINYKLFVVAAAAARSSVSWEGSRAAAAVAVSIN